MNFLIRNILGMNFGNLNKINGVKSTLSDGDLQYPKFIICQKIRDIFKV